MTRWEVNTDGQVSDTHDIQLEVTKTAEIRTFIDNTPMALCFVATDQASDCFDWKINRDGTVSFKGKRMSFERVNICLGGRALEHGKPKGDVIWEPGTVEVTNRDPKKKKKVPGPIEVAVTFDGTKVTVGENGQKIRVPQRDMSIIFTLTQTKGSGAKLTHFGLDNEGASHGRDTFLWRPASGNRLVVYDTGALHKHTFQYCLGVEYNDKMYWADPEIVNDMGYDPDPWHPHGE